MSRKKTQTVKLDLRTCLAVYHEYYGDPEVKLGIPHHAHIWNETKGGWTFYYWCEGTNDSTG